MIWIFSLFQTLILQASAGRKIQFKLGKNPVHQTGYIFQTGELQKSSADRLRAREVVIITLTKKEIDRIVPFPQNSYLKRE